MFLPYAQGVWESHEKLRRGMSARLSAERDGGLLAIHSHPLARRLQGEGNGRVEKGVVQLVWGRNAHNVKGEHRGLLKVA